jgi:hypothetical protein
VASKKHGCPVSNPLTRLISRFGAPAGYTLRFRQQAGTNENFTTEVTENTEKPGCRGVGPVLHARGPTLRVATRFVRAGGPSPCPPLPPW